MALSKGDRVTINGHSSVPGLEEGFEYRVEGTREIRGLDMYVFKCENTGEYVKLGIEFVDELVDDDNYPLERV